MIYIHIPFCRTFCTYCDFYSEIAPKCCKDGGYSGFVNALSAEIHARRDEITDDINTLYIGGGTPSVLPLCVLEQVLGVLGDVGHGGPYDEFTLEVNPDDIVEKGEEYVEGLLRLGVNRVSMGVQSFDDGILKWMNRRHDAAAAVRAYAILEDAGVPEISIDLIFGLPQLSDSRWYDTLSKAIDISSGGIPPRHVSAYQLSVEPGSALAGMVERRMWSEASEELCARQYEMLCDVMRRAGYVHYEISNFAQPGFEAKHNSAYWTHSPYVGFGPGAHSFLQTRSALSGTADSNCPVRRWNTSDLGAYMAAAEAGDFSRVTGQEELSPGQLALEHVMLGLRTSSGLPEQFLRSCCQHQALQDFLESGDLVRLPDGCLRIPENRFFVSDSIISAIV